MAVRIVQHGSGSVRPLVLVYNLNARNDAALIAAAGSNAFIGNDTTVGSTYNDTPPLSQTTTDLAPDGVTFSPVVVCGFSAGGEATLQILNQGGNPDILVVADGTYGSSSTQWSAWQTYADQAKAGQRRFYASYTSLMVATSTWHVLCALTGISLPVGTRTRWQQGDMVVYGYPSTDQAGHEFQGDSVLPMMLREALGRSFTPLGKMLVASAVGALALAALVLWRRQNGVVP